MIDKVLKRLKLNLPGREYWHDFVGMGLRGLFFTVPTSFIFQAPELMLFGFLMAPVYCGVTALYRKYKANKDPIPAAEFVWGAFLGVYALLLSFYTPVQI